MFGRLAQIIRPGHSVNVVSPAPKTAAMPAEYNSVGSKDPPIEAEGLSPASAASIGRGINQSLQSIPMDSFCVMAADTPHCIIPYYLNRIRRAMTPANCISCPSYAHSKYSG